MIEELIKTFMNKVKTDYCYIGFVHSSIEFPTDQWTIADSDGNNVGQGITLEHALEDGIAPRLL